MTFDKNKVFEMMQVYNRVLMHTIGACMLPSIIVNALDSQPSIEFLAVSALFP